MLMIQPAHPPVNLVITTGEPAGIGPEVSVRAARHFIEEQPNARITLLGDVHLLNRFSDTPEISPDHLKIQAIPLASTITPGAINSANAPYVLSMLDQAMNGCLHGHYDAMITAPIQKSAINDAGISFSGHTEYLAQFCKVKRVVMMLCAPLQKGFLDIKNPTDLRVALVTTHLPLKEVPKILTQELIIETIQIVDRDLRTKFGISKPQIRVAGLNPHAGEFGYLGNEEIQVISPAIESAKHQGILVSGPYPGDTLFDVSVIEEVDAFIATYHDQGLAPFKFVTFGGGVNVTLGLPIIRTSVDHGTALDIAGKGIADSGSMLEALRMAYSLAINKRNLS